MTAPTQTAVVMALELIACDGKRVMVPIHRLIQSFTEMQRAPGRNAIARIQSAVGVFYKVSRTDMRANRRHGEVTHARHVAMYLCKTRLLFSLPHIGREFGGRDHTTVLHALRKIEARIVSSSSLRADIGLITAMLDAGERE